MKNFKYLILFITTAILLSCEADNGVDYLHDESPEARISKQIENYSMLLTGPENGWIGYYSPNKSYGAYTLLTRFNADGNVVINSDYNLGGSNGEVLYRIDKTDKVELVFETHGLLHEIFETEDNSIDGDFAFNFISTSEEEIILEGKIDPTDDITRLVLTPAAESDWELDSVYEMINNLNNSAENSYFRNVTYNDESIASFKFNSITRLSSLLFSVSETKDSIISQPISIKPTGIEFLLKPEINGVVLDGEFLYDSQESAFINTEESLKIVHSDVPHLLEHYDFGARYNIRYNYLEPEKSSSAFDVFFNNYIETVFADYGVSIDRVYIRDLNEEAPNLHIYTNAGRVRAYVTYEVRDDEKVYFSLTGDSNVDLSEGEIWHTILNPLLEVIIGSETGYFIENTGGLLRYTNGTVTLINADHPKYAINYYDFN